MKPPDLGALLDKCAAATRPQNQTQPEQDTMNTWTDFNNAEQQNTFDLIPAGTAARVRMTIKPGAFDDAAQGWTGGYATQSYDTGSVYLACEFVILEGPHAKRKVWSNIGLHSPKGPAWGVIGRSFIRAILHSARAVRPQDASPAAIAARRIDGLHELDGIEFVARIDVEKDGRGELRNVIKVAIQPDQPDYARLMASVQRQTGSGGGASGAPLQPALPRQLPAATQQHVVPATRTWTL
jgi:hypothetical protein